jgi:hypothetical protein
MPPFRLSRVATESLLAFTIRRNQCSRFVGITVHHRSESVFTLRRNMQSYVQNVDSSGRLGV